MGSVLIIGVGGLGAPAALSLAEAGHALRLVDPDRVELSNLQRQVLFGTADLDRPKVACAAERLTQVVPGVQVEPVFGRFDDDTAAELLDGVDLVLDCTDDPAARFLVNDLAVARGLPAVIAGVIRFEGLVVAVAGGHGPCFRCLFETPPAPDEVLTCARSGVLGAMAGVVGHLQALRAISLLSGDVAAATGFVTTVDGLRGRVRHVPLPEGADCPTCGGLARRVDVTADLCPMTYVRTKLALEPLAPGALVEVVMRRGEPARNVPRSLREDGHQILAAGEIARDRFRVLVRRAPAPAPSAL